MFAIITGGMWKTATVSEEPSIVLHNWKVMTTREGSFFAGDRSVHESRVSTDIVVFDPDTGKGITASGRIYQLKGPEVKELSGNAAYVWANYKRVNRLIDL